MYKDTVINNLTHISSVQKGDICLLLEQTQALRTSQMSSRLMLFSSMTANRIFDFVIIIHKIILI